MVIRRGEIWWAALDTPFGFEPGYRRPVLIIQINEFNESPIRTVITIPFSSNLLLARSPGNVLCKRRYTGLSKDSVANVSQVATLDKTRLVKTVGNLPLNLMTRIEAGLRLIQGF